MVDDGGCPSSSSSFSSSNSSSLVLDYEDENEDGTRTIATSLVPGLLAYDRHPYLHERGQVPHQDISNSDACLMQLEGVKSLRNGRVRGIGEGEIAVHVKLVGQKPCPVAYRRGQVGGAEQ
jgi:hypothetical protein